MASDDYLSEAVFEYVSLFKTSGDFITFFQKVTG